MSDKDTNIEDLRKKFQDLGIDLPKPRLVNFNFYNLSDTGNALRFVAQHKENIRYCHEYRQWYLWDTLRWRPDRTCQIRKRAQDTVVSIFEQCTQSIDDEERKRLARHALKSESRDRLAAIRSKGA